MAYTMGGGGEGEVVTYTRGGGRWRGGHTIWRRVEKVTYYWAEGGGGNMLWGGGWRGVTCFL